MRFLDLTGQRFERLVVLSYEKVGQKTKWNCRCDCGNHTSAATSDLRSGKTKSCGCLRNEQNLTNKMTHGMSSSPEHSNWTAMKNRCLNPNGSDFNRYGGRGITIDPRWINSFEAFYADMGPRPTPEHTLERKDNDQGYSKDNCTWATRKEQARNQSTTLRYEYKGQLLSLREITELEGVSFDMVYQRMRNMGMTLEEALNPVHFR
jgi:hypothetical protein